MHGVTFRPLRHSELDPLGQAHLFLGVIDAPDSLKTCLEAEGCCSPGIGSYGIYLWLYDRHTAQLAAPTMPGVAVERGLSPEGLLIPWVAWRAFGVLVHADWCSVLWPSPSGATTITAMRVRLHNGTGDPRLLRLFVALRPLGPAGYEVHQLAVSDDRRALLAEGHPAIVGAVPATLAGVRDGDHVGDDARAGTLPARREATSPEGQCSGALAYDLTLAPGELWQSAWICPVLAGRRATSHQWDRSTAWFQLDLARPGSSGPLQPDPGLQFYAGLCADELFAAAFRYWTEQSGSLRLDLPDPRWHAFTHAAVGHIALMLNEGQPDPAVVNLNVFNRDAAYMANMLDKAGQPALAERVVRWFLEHPFAGRIEPEADNPGQALWALAEHWRLTRDPSWLSAIAPAVRRLVALIRYLRTTPEPHYVAEDSLAYGDELPDTQRKRIRPGACDGTHPEYTEAFDIAGLRQAAALADAWGDSAAAAAWRALADELFVAYDQRFGRRPEAGYGAYAVLWPCRLYAFDDPHIRRCFGSVGARAASIWRYFAPATAHQGLFAGNRTAGYGTIALHLDEAPMQGWYVLDEGGPSGVGGWPALRTTWSCATPRTEWAPLAADAMPHGWALAELWLLLRDSLVYEYNEQLIMLAGIDPAWFTATQPWSVNNLPTWYGPFGCRWRYRGQQAGRHQAEFQILGGALPPQGYRLCLPAWSRVWLQITAPDAGTCLQAPPFDLTPQTTAVLVEWIA